MDFVARAGAIIDRAHRIAGVLLICLVVMTLITMCQFSENSDLRAKLDDKRIRYPVIVVPDATTGVYSPTEEDRLIALFSDFITQSLNSYTPENISRLYAGLRPFMSPAMLTDSEVYFQRKIRDSMGDRRSSFFVPDRSRPVKVERRNVNGVEYRDISMLGQINTIVGGTVAEGAPLEVQMTFQKSFASPANPYGFMLSKYYEKLLINPNTSPQLPTAPR